MQLCLSGLSGSSSAVSWGTQEPPAVLGAQGRALAGVIGTEISFLFTPSWACMAQVLLPVKTLFPAPSSASKGLASVLRLALESSVLTGGKISREDGAASVELGVDGDNFGACLGVVAVGCSWALSGAFCACLAARESRLKNQSVTKNTDYF